MDLEKNKAFARALAKVCREHDAYNIDITFTLPEPGGAPFEHTRMTYNKGRHGSEGTINLIVTTHIGDFKEFGDAGED
jgi:hypothetical protein